MKLITNQGRRILFFFSSSLREARTRADEIRSPFPFPFFFLFFFFPSPLPCPSARMSNNTRLKHLLSPLGFGCILPRVPPPSRYVSRDPQKTSTPRTRNLISFSRLVTATAPRAGILRPTYLLFFQRERRGKGNVQRESPSQKPPSDNVFSPATIILPFRFVVFAPPLLETNLYIRRRNSGRKEKERNKVFFGREEFRRRSKNIAKFRSRVIRAAVNK